MTNKQAKDAARRIPFNPAVPLPLAVYTVLTRVVARQGRRSTMSDHERWARRDGFRREMGEYVPLWPMQGAA